MNKEIILTNEQSDTVAEYIRRLGTAASLGLLHPLCKIFTIPSIDGIIGYRESSGCLVALGDPVCAPTHRLQLFHAFHSFCTAQGKRSISVLTTPEHNNELLTEFGGRSLQFGHEIIIDATVDKRTLSGPYPHHLRQKYNHAREHGLTFHEYTGYNMALENTLQTIAQEWLAHRKGPQVYLIPLDIFAHRATKRWFYAQKENQIVGFIMLNELDRINGWVLNGSAMLTADAPGSCSEFLFINTLEVLRAEGYSALSAGPTVSPHFERMEGFGKMARFLLHLGMKSARSLFKMKDRQRYWKKFLPHKEPSFVTFNAPTFGWHEIEAVLRAFNVQLLPFNQRMP